MTDTTHPKHPVREPAPGPAVILDMPALYAAVRAEMDARGYRHGKQVCDDTGIDRNTIGRFFQRGAAGTLVEGQRGGLNVNAYLTLVTWLHDAGVIADYGRALRRMPLREKPF